MNELTIPSLVAVRPHENLSDLPMRNAAQDPVRVVFGRHEGDHWSDVTAAQFLAEVRALAKGFMASGLRAGDRIALMSRTRYEWTLVDFASWTAGLVVVPIYETSSASQARFILADSGARAIVVETPRHEQVIAAAADAAQEPADEKPADVGTGEAAYDAPVTVAARMDPDLVLWQIDAAALDELAALGAAEVSDEDLDARRSLASHETVATIIYTSGTTGRPKGCEITHGNLMLLSENAALKLPEVVKAPGASLVLFLPLAHVLARYICVLAVDTGMRIGHSPDVSNLLGDLQSFRPTLLLAVPRVLEKVYNASDQKSAAEGKGRIFRLATRVAIAYSRATEAGRPSPWLTVQHRVFDLLVYKKIRAAMGGQVAFIVSGGGPLGERLGHFYRGCGITILEGYGLTETTAPASVGLPSASRVGTVGPPLPGVSIRIADDSEVLIKGVGVFRGYHDNPAATAEVFTDDGWLITGDLGRFDDDGFLRITGRKKEIIVTAGGKNVSPTQLEDVVRAHPLVSQCLVVGDNRPFISALVTLDEEMLPSWAAAHDLPELTADSARSHPVVREHIQGAVDRANAQVSRAESIRQWVMLEDDFTEANGYLTPSLKLKRTLITRDFAAVIDGVYGGPVQDS